MIGEWLESGHAQLDVEMFQSDDIEIIPSIAQFNFKLVLMESDVLLQIFQQDHHQVEQYLDWLADQLGQECPMHDVDEETLNDVP